MKEENVVLGEKYIVIHPAPYFEVGDIITITKKFNEIQLNENMFHTKDSRYIINCKKIESYKEDNMRDEDKLKDMYDEENESIRRKIELNNKSISVNRLLSEIDSFKLSKEKINRHPKEYIDIFRGKNLGLDEAKKIIKSLARMIDDKEDGYTEKTPDNFDIRCPRCNGKNITREAIVGNQEAWFCNDCQEYFDVKVEQKFIKTRTALFDF